MHSETFANVPVVLQGANLLIGKDGAIITVEQGQGMLERIQQWPHWEYIGAVARKEYHLSEERFRELLPEYQKFLCLIVLGVQGLGMFDADIDNLWHSHILATLRYQQFYDTFHEGEMIHHLPQLDTTQNNICTVCRSCTGCSTPHDCDNALTPHEASNDPNYFAQAYVQAFGERPSSLWKLARFQGTINSEYLPHE